MKTSCMLVLCLGVALTTSAPSVFQRNGLQREQEGATYREPFEPLSPFQLSHANVPAGGNNIVVPPTIQVDPTLPKSPALGSESYLPPPRNFLSHFEVLNKDALVGYLLEKDIPFYVKTIVEPMKPVQTKIHVMRIPKKLEPTTPLPDLNLNMVEIVNMNASEQEAYKSDGVKQVESMVAASRKVSHSDVIVKVTEDISQEQTDTSVLTVTGSNVTHESPVQNDAPADPVTTTPVYEHAIIYTPEKRPDSKSIWEHVGSAYDKAKEKTSELVSKAKVKGGELLDKAREKAKDVLDSDESKKDEKEVVNPADDI